MSEEIMPVLLLLYSSPHLLNDIKLTFREGVLGLISLFKPYYYEDFKKILWSDGTKVDPFDRIFGTVLYKYRPTSR